MIREFYLFSGFYLYNKYMESYYNKKNARNMVAFTHASGSVVINFLYFLSYYIFGSSMLLTKFLLKTSFNYSIGYFLYDLYYILSFDKLNFLRYCYIYHHLGAMYIIYNSHLLTAVPIILFTGELSNIPSYYIYHNLHLDNKTYETEQQVVTYKKIQKYLYGFLRVPVMSYLMYDITSNIFASTENFISSPYLGLLTAGFPIYLMGLAWTYQLFKNN